MKRTYVNPSDWLGDIEKALLNPTAKQNRLAKVTNEYIGDTVTTEGVMPEDTGDLKRDVQRKSVPKNGLVMTNLYYAVFANEYNLTGTTDYLETLWEQQPGVYRDMYNDLLVNDVNKI